MSGCLTVCSSNNQEVRLDRDLAAVARGELRAEPALLTVEVLTGFVPPVSSFSSRSGHCNQF